MRTLSAAILVAFFSHFAAAEDAVKPGLNNKVFKDKDGSESPYVVFVPHDYDGTKEFPIILFLHGAGETKGGTK